MAKLISLVLVLVVVVLVSTVLSPAHSRSQNPIKFRFYLQDKYTRPDRTVYPVARSDITATSPTSFGEVSVVNDPLTLEPNHTADVIGYAQGIIASADLTVPGIHATITFFFTGGPYKGSSFNMVGRNNLFQKLRKIPVVGGTEAFELAQGIITTRNYSSDPELGRATFQYDVTIYSYYSLAMNYY